MSKYIFNNDTDILEFLEQLRENGIQIWGEGEKIRYRSKNRQLAPETLRILKMAKGQILDFFRMIEKNVIPLTSIQTAYVVGQTAGCELGNINAHYYIEYTIESLDVERLEQMINLVISKNDALRLIVTHEGKASFLDNVPYYSVPVYSLYDGNDREQKRLERSHHRYNYYKWPMFHFCVGKTSGKTSVLHVDFDCIILDAWSAKLLLNEIFSLYYGKDVKFPRISFMNYMRLKTDKGDLEAEEYWKEKVKNMPSFPKLNYQKKFAEVQNVRFDRIECDFSFIETQRLYQKIKNYHFTPAAVISTIFMKTLAQYSETPGLSINVTLFNRQLLHEDVNGILGEFTNNAVISYQEKTDSLLDAIRANSKEKVKKYKEEIIEILKKKQTIDEFITDNDYETNVYPLTDVQAAYLVGKTEAVKWGGIGCKGYIEVDFGSYSAEELSRAWKVLVNRHEMLRAKVTEVGFEILERDEIDYEIKIVNLQKMAEREKVDTLSKIREDFSEYVFHTEEPPLFKVLITKRIEGNFFHLLVDLIVSDFASVQLLISEMGELLKGASLEKIRYKFSDYAMFNQQRKGSLKWHQDRMYWLERLKKLPEAPILPQDGRAADKCENTYEFYRFQKHINQSDWKRIKEIAGEYGVTVSSVLIGIYAEVISRWSSNKHFTLNLPIQNRPTIGNNTNSIVGDFTAVNLLEVNVTQNMSFIERVKEITKRLMEDLEHNSFSGVEVLRELSKVSEEKELLMPIVFTGVLKTDGTVGTIEYGFSHTPQVWIDCQIVDEIDSEDQEKGLMISWDTRKGAIKESIVTEMFESFTETIRILGIKHSEEWKNPLEIIVPSASKKKVICERNKGITNQSRIQQRFVKYAKKNSNKTAVIDAVETVTYGELLERAEYIAGYLRKEFVENRTGLVAIRMKKSVNQIAAVMGVLIAGFSYLPIDIKQPLARQEKILSKANVIVELDEKKVNMILQNLEYRLEKHPEFQNPIAYVIFTSGSTGEPKGVVMSHTAAQNTLISIENMYNISEEDTILGIAELSFDLSVFDIFSVLGVGGTLVLPNPEKGPDASHWGRLLNEYKVTLWNSVPAQAEMLDAFASKSESYPTVRLVLLSGDWINTSLPGRLRKIMTNAQMISLGGATEGGIWSIYHEIDEIEERPTILYGKALLGQWMGVVDEELRICPEYVSGQIAIGGYSLAEGYLGDTILTKEKFVYLEEEKNRIYLTGDNGRYVENGDIEFLGRLDNQVKINGHRIEIAEIENAIRGMQNIEDCCVVYNQSIGKGVLIAFIKNKISSISYTKEEYRKQLAFFLPPAMIPSEFVNVESFPLSTNGKIDRKGLAESIQKNIKVKHNAKATLISQKKEYVELAKSIKKIVCSISGNDYIDYEDNLLENGLDSLLLSQISGRIVSDIQEAQGMRFDEILRASLTMPTIMGIAQYISDCKNPSKNQMHSNAGNQTRNSYTVVYIFGDNENEIRDVLIEKLSASNISCKRVGGQEIIERCHEDINVKKKYIIAFSEMASLCITKASELLGENIIINRIFLINPSKAKESDLYLGDISIIDGNSVAIKSWEKAVLGNVREFESNSNDIFDIIMRELENDK